MKLAVHRWLGTNAGDEAVQTALASAFGDDVEWTSIDLWESPDAAVAAVGACDGLVIGGGTILGNLPTWLVDEAALARIRVPIGLFGTGIRDQGRSAIDPERRAGVARVVARAYPRGVRGPLSVALLETLPAPRPAVEVAGDPALLLAARATAFVAPRSATTGVGVNVRVRDDGGERATVAMLRAYLAGAGRTLRDDVRFFACDQRWDPRAAALVDAPVEPYRDLDGLLRWIGARRLIISERLHGAILAHALGIPAVLIAYERKCWDYARSIGLVSSCVEPGDVAGLARAVDEADADLARARPRIARLADTTRAMVASFRRIVERSRVRRPASLPHDAPARPGDGRTLIGLLMIRDEEDVLAETLRNHARFCAAIFVLDGTEGDAQRESERIARACPAVREYWHDRDTGLPLPLRDGARRFLLDRARRHFDRGNWYAVLHGDEIWGEDPRPYLDDMPPEHDVLAVRLFHFFPHVSQAGAWDFGTLGAVHTSIEAQARWYMLPPVVEHRIFWDGGHADYDTSRHSRTVPDGLTWWTSPCVVKQYNYRSPARACARARQRTSDGWQANHYQHLLDGPDGFFRETLEMPDARWAASVPLGTGTVAETGSRPLPIWRERAV